MLSFTAHDPAQDAHYERHPVEDLEPEPESEFERLGVLLSKVMVWLAEPRSRNISGLKSQRGTSRKYSPSKANLRLAAFIYSVSWVEGNATAEISEIEFARPDP